MNLIASDVVDRGPIQYTCPLSGFQKLTGGKHKLRIIWALRNGPATNSDLRRATELYSEFAMAPRVFNRELLLLRASGLIERKALSVSGRQTKYCLTDLGMRLVPLLFTRWQ